MNRLISIYALLLTCSFLLLTACQENKDSTVENTAGNQLQQLQEKLAMQETNLSKAEVRIKTLLNLEENYPLVHTVYFNLKESATKVELQELFAAIEKLHDIEVVHNLEIGFFADLKDKRALKDLEWVFQMRFKNEAAYKIYQEHPLHLELKNVAKPLLDGPPVTHDFMSQP